MKANGNTNFNSYCGDKKPKQLKTELRMEVHDTAELRP